MRGDGGKIDFEAAWTDLQEKILERDGWGTRTLTAEMADIAVRNRVPEGPLERALRMGNGRLARAIARIMSTAEETTSVGPGTTPDHDESDPAHLKAQEVTDGSRSRRSTAAAGR